MLEEQLGLLIPVYLTCVQKPTTNNEKKTKLLFLDVFIFTQVFLSHTHHFSTR